MRRQEHAAAVRAMSDAVRSAPAGQPVRLAKKTSNLFRARGSAAGPRLDVAGLAGVIDIDVDGAGPPMSAACAPTRTSSRRRSRSG